jgi:hypothetical protein
MTKFVLLAEINDPECCGIVAPHEIKAADVIPEKGDIVLDPELKRFRVEYREFLYDGIGGENGSCTITLKCSPV